MRETLERALATAVRLINARFVKPVDEEMLRKLDGGIIRLIVTTGGKCPQSGGFGEYVTGISDMRRETDAAGSADLALPDDYIEHGNVDVLRNEVDAGH